MVGMLAGIGLIILVGFFGNILYSRTRIPESLFLLIAGAIIGMFTNAQASMLGISEIFTTIALIIVLMEGGINLDLFGIVKSINMASVFTLMSSMLSIAASFAILRLFGFDPSISLLFSISIAGTTSITIIHLMEKFRVTKDVKEILIMESVITDVFLITAVVIIMQIRQLSKIAVDSILSTIFSQISIAFLLGIAAGMFWLYFLGAMRKHSLIYISTLAVLLLLYDSVEFVGGNGPIAVLTFSMFLGNITRLASRIRGKTAFSEIKESLIRSIKSIEREFSFFIKTFFFVYIGTLVNLERSLSFVAPAIALTAGLMAARYAATSVFGRFERNFMKYRRLITASIPRGFSSILIALMLVENSLMPVDMINLTVLIIFSTTLVSMFGGILNSRRP